MLPNQSRGRASGTFLIGVSQLLHLGPTLTSPPSWTKDKCCTQALEPPVHGATLLIFVPWLLVPCNILNFPNISSSTLEIWFWTRFTDVPVLILLWWIYHCHGGKLINCFYSLVGNRFSYCALKCTSDGRTITIDALFKESTWIYISKMFTSFRKFHEIYEFTL